MNETSSPPSRESHVLSRRGHVDRLTATEAGLLVEGWAASDSIEPRPQVSARLGSRSYTATADLPRADLAAAGIGDGRYGFNLWLPGAPAADVGQLALSMDGVALRPGAGTELQGEALTSAWPPLIRHEGERRWGVAYANAILRLWFDEPAPPSVAVELDRELVWTGEPRRVEAAFVDGEQRTGCGLRIRLPAPTGEVEHRTLRVLVGDRPLPGPPIRIDHAARYRGYVEALRRLAATDGVARGWCLDLGAPSEPVRLHVRQGDRVIGEGLTSGTRPDLLQAGYDGPDSLFQIPFTLAGPEAIEVSVTPASSPRALPGVSALPASIGREPLRLAFAVTDTAEDTGAGDYWTALELGSALAARHRVEVRYLQAREDAWFDVGDAQVLVAMRDDYDPRRIRADHPSLVRIAYVRNWFERFAQQARASDYDAVWAASEPAAQMLSGRLGAPVQVLPIATNHRRFGAGRPDPAYASDYCFTGSYWGVNREIAQNLDPSGLPFRFALFGQGWDGHSHLAPYARGHLPYAELPNVYASTHLVIDDANHATRRWASVNSRVFDALAAGALVVSNVEGADALFNGLLPTYRTPQELEALLWTYLDDEEARVARVQALREIILTKHTYDHRADVAWSWLQRLTSDGAAALSRAST